MNTATLIEIFGYLGSALVVISMLMHSIFRLRVINLIGSVISGTYAVIVGALPLGIMNMCLIIINLYNLFKLRNSDRESAVVPGTPGVDIKTDFKDVVLSRKSIRGYKDTPVSKQKIQEILQLATRSASANNTQPWEFFVVTGDALLKMRQKNVELLRAKASVDMPDADFDGIYKERSRVLGKELFSLMGIEREDKEKRAEWVERGFRFFDAPALILICIDNALDINAFRFDIGAVAQNICLVAAEKGLGTCIEYQAVMYNNHYYDILNIPKNKTFICGIAIGEIDTDFPANKIESKRESIDDITGWIGF